MAQATKVPAPPRRWAHCPTIRAGETHKSLHGPLLLMVLCRHMQSAYKLFLSDIVTPVGSRWQRVHRGVQIAVGRRRAEQLAWLMKEEWRLERGWERDVSSPHTPPQVCGHKTGRKKDGGVIKPAPGGNGFTHAGRLKLKAESLPLRTLDRAWCQCQHRCQHHHQRKQRAQRLPTPRPYQLHGSDAANCSWS